MLVRLIKNIDWRASIYNHPEELIKNTTMTKIPNIEFLLLSRSCTGK